jgi:hypothetical protein
LSLTHFLAHLTSGFVRFGNHPPFGLAEAALLLLSFALGFSASDVIVPRGTRNLRHPSTPQWEFLVTFPVGVHCVWIAASFITLGIVKLFHNDSSFETIFSVFVFGSIPALIAWVSGALRNFSYAANRCWQAASLLLHICSVWLLGTGMHSTCHLYEWQAIAAALPMAATLLVFGAALTFKKPVDTFQACLPWRRMPGERVVVFYTKRRDRQQVEEIVRGADACLRDVQDLLNLEPLTFKVWLFLCQDQEQHRKLVHHNRDKTAPMAGGYAHHDSISLVYSGWDEIAGAVAHEFCHVVRRHRITPELLGILDEGLSTYVTEKLYPRYTTPAITLVPNLQIVANTAVFFEWTRTDKPALYSRYCYQHAHALADYLISRYGLPQYYTLCREVAASKEPTEGRKLAAAVEKVYGSSLTVVERSWRRTWPQTWRAGQSRFDFGDETL